MKYCTAAKSTGRGRPIWMSVAVPTRIACALRPDRSIPVTIFLPSQCAERCANDAFLTSLRATLRCPETLFISHEIANFLFSVFRVVQGEAKTPKIMGCCRANFAFLHALKIGTFRGKWTLAWVIKTSHFVLLALYFLITGKLAFSLIAFQRCLARTAKNVWVRAQNSAKNNFLPHD